MKPVSALKPPAKSKTNTTAKAGKEQNQHYRQSRQSSLKAGGDINIRSREGDITVQGSNIT
ncbi:hemagglutinin repeat-containing protein, partial [Neisseria sp. P0014.S009]|uniref:hemagglutinin repeat-containing protein n=1 Tax=Neisseria sp. P0014.S009 TaxID=3436755 RepID=UPI003F7DCF11